MFDVSWGELLVLTGVGFALIGKKDLPRAAGMVGHRLGRVVGFLQGARARADQFAQQSELKQLHNELKSGLRELDAVKAEMAIATQMGRSFAAGSPNPTNRTVLSSSSSLPPSIGATPSSIGSSSTPYLAATNATVPQQYVTATTTATRLLPPESQTIAAVAEEEWSKQGIGFRSRAERGVGLGYTPEQASSSGSAILANLYQQNLIFDQYDRVVQQQDDILKSKVEAIQSQKRGPATDNEQEEDKKKE